MVFWRPILGNTTRDLKILSNYSFYIDTRPPIAVFCENAYDGHNLRFSMGSVTFAERLNHNIAVTQFIAVITYFYARQTFVQDFFACLQIRLRSP